MREAARCMEAAQAARAAGLERERLLASEISSLRQQLAGKLPVGDPAREAQDRLGQLSAAHARLQQERTALLAQVQQLSSVGQELSASCHQLEAGMQAAVRERDGLQAAAAQAQAAQAAAQQRWEQQRQQLEARLASAQESTQGSQAQARALQAQLEEAQQAQQAAAAREQEVRTEHRVAAAAAQAENKAALAEAARLQEQLRGREAELAAARQQAAQLEGELGRLQVGCRDLLQRRACLTPCLRASANTVAMLPALRCRRSCGGAARSAPWRPGTCS